jgi:hypothetical protein
MATINHKDIPDGERHEPKGVSTATAGQVYVASGSGSGTWLSLISKITASLTPTAVTANDSVAQVYTVTGITTSQTLLNVIPPSNTGDTVIGSARITGANEVTVTWANVHNSSATPPAGTYTFVVAA